MKLAIFLATLGGFIGLSYEILWVRVYTFVSWGAANAFGILLGAYLAGLAIGAFVARRYCAREAEKSQALRWLAFYFLAASLAGYALIPAVAEAVRHVGYAWTLPAFALVATLLGTALPLISHFGIPADERAGQRLSHLYVGNIAGSAAGSMLTGFVLMDAWSIRSISLFLALAGFALAAGILIAVDKNARRRLLVGGAIAASALLSIAAAEPLFDGVYEKLQFKSEYESHVRFDRVIETRSGVVTVLGDTVYGGGVYDGKFSVDPFDDVNGIRRAYALAAVHPHPREILVIGLGSGSWARVVAAHPAATRITVLEISHGYVELIRGIEGGAELLDDPRVEVVVDDGRRWLLRTDRKFDAIVQNTTYHYRSHSTNLLAREHMELCRAHLNAGGVLIFNTTWSDRAQRTAATVFPHALRYQNCMYVSDAPMGPDKSRWENVMRAYFPNRPAAFVAASKWEARSAILKRTAGLEVITDDNMACEWLADPQTAKPR
ncbi:MAG: fused MFS/spermidine synthase [Planctomycetota bacterium]